ncbi:MFS transporter [Antrihabitans cavernicola]|uniref:MFS transporter n=2 Tax=Antrihabitans cavernicola TaxID=2495913 RepID=A0A5A7SJX8_9NOCA|nr:MFS transporter [Spelaeibacter cavernicola]
MMQDEEQRAGRKEWTGLAVLALPLLLVSMDVSVLYFAVPFISRDLDPSATQQLWIFDIYGFVLAGLLLTMGSLGDRIGRRRLLLIGAVGFSLASILAAYAPSAEVLIAARAILGIAGATLMPSTLALIRNMFHNAEDRGKAIAIWTAVMTGGISLGPVISGALLEHFWWGSVFLINIPAMLLLLAIGPVLLPEFRPPNPGRFDYISSVLSLAAILPLIYGIKEWAANGFSADYVGFIVVGLIFGGAFVQRQRVVPDSILDLSLFANRGFNASAIANSVAMFALVGNAVFMTQYLQSVLAMSPLKAALWSLAPSVVVAGAAPIATTLGAKVNRAYVLAGGFLIAAAGFAIVANVHATSSLAVILIGAAVLSAGLVAVMTLVTEVALGAIPPERAGSASAVIETGSEFGGALGIAILGSIGAAVYGNHVASAIPAGTPDETRHAIRETLGGAIAVTDHLPNGGAILAAARDAFTTGMNVEASAGAVVMVAAAILCALFLRNAGHLDTV